MSLRRLVLPLSLAMAAVTAAGCASTAAPPDAPDAPVRAGAAASTQRVTVSVPSGRTAAPFDRSRQVVVPTGWKMSVWERLDAPRLAVWTPDGRMLVSRPRSGDVVVLTPRAGKVPSSYRIVTGLRQPHGLAMLGNTLYVAESNQIDTYAYSKGTLSGRKTIITGLPDAKSPELGGQYAHALKSVAVAKDGTVYLSIGSTGNVSAEDRSATPQRATIMSWSPATKKLSVYTRGVRNGTGLAIDFTGHVWTAVNNRDQMSYPYHEDYDGKGGDDYKKVMPSYVNDHPMEELARLSPGRDLGWPYCNPDADVSPGKPGSKAYYAKPRFVRDAILNSDGSKLDCDKLPRIELGFPAHSAPLGLSFATLPAPFGSGALVGTHGSWNRTPPRAPTVTFYPWVNGTLSGGTVLVSGFQNADGSRWGRPVAAVRGPDGAVYITDDSANAIYRLVKA